MPGIDGLVKAASSKKLSNSILKVQNKTMLDTVAIAALLHIRVLLELLQHLGSPFVLGASRLWYCQLLSLDPGAFIMREDDPEYVYVG